MTPQQIHVMKRQIVSLVLACAAGLVFAGCASDRSNGTVQVNVHVPQDMVSQPITIFVDGHPVSTTTNLTQTMSLVPYWKNKIKVEMAGARPFKQSIKVAGNGSTQVLDVTLAKQ
jgi:hypothetical protein